jgi:hypothetical protein
MAQHHRTDAMSSVVALFEASAVVRRSKSLDVLSRRPPPERDYTRSAAAILTPIRTPAGTPPIRHQLSPLRSKSVEGLGDASDEDGHPHPQPITELVRVYDVVGSPMKQTAATETLV